MSLYAEIAKLTEAVLATEYSEPSLIGPALMVGADNAQPTVASVETAHIDIFIKLVDDDSRRTVSSRKFTALEHASGDSPAPGVEALNRAFHKIVPAIVKWVARVRVAAKES